MASVVSAAEAPGEMHKAITAMKKEEHSNLKAGSLKLANFQEIAVKEADLDTGTVQMALAEYTTVRDSIFPSVHQEIVFYDPENGEVLQEGQVGAIEEVRAFKEAQGDITAAKLQMGLIITLLIVVPIVFVLLIVLIWEPRQYSVTKFKNANRLFYGQNETFQ